MLNISSRFQKMVKRERPSSSLSSNLTSTRNLSKTTLELWKFHRKQICITHLLLLDRPNIDLPALCTSSNADWKISLFTASSNGSVATKSSEPRMPAFLGSGWPLGPLYLKKKTAKSQDSKLGAKSQQRNGKVILGLRFTCFLSWRSLGDLKSMFKLYWYDCMALWLYMSHLDIGYAWCLDGAIICELQALETEMKCKTACQGTNQNEFQQHLKDQNIVSHVCISSACSLKDLFEVGTTTSEENKLLIAGA